MSIFSKLFGHKPDTGQSPPIATPPQGSDQSQGMPTTTTAPPSSEPGMSPAPAPEPPSGPTIGNDLPPADTPVPSFPQPTPPVDPEPGEPTVEPPAENQTNSDGTPSQPNTPSSSAL